MRPEEKVRSRLLDYLTEKLNYPRELIAVEKELSLLPGCASAPKRRLDVLVYLKRASELYPLLIIECKAGRATRAALEQVLGYNHTVQAPFVAVVGNNTALTAGKDGAILGGLLFYEELIAAL